MDIKIIGEHLTVTEAMHDYVTSKFTALHTPEKLMQVEFRIIQEKNTTKVCFLSHYNQKDNFIESKGSNFYEAFDLLMEKIKRNFAEHKNTHSAKTSLSIKKMFS